MAEATFDPNAAAVGQGRISSGRAVNWYRDSNLQDPYPKEVESRSVVEILDAQGAAILARANGLAGWLPSDRVEIRKGPPSLEAIAAAAIEGRNKATNRMRLFADIQRGSPLPVIEQRHPLPGGLELFADEFLVAVGKDWGWSSQKLTLTTHRVIYSRGRLAKDQEAVYLTDVRDIKYHKPLVGFGTLVLETAGGHSIEGLPAASNGQQLRDKLLQLVHFARQRATLVPAPVAATPDRFDQLKKLAELKQTGVLTENEFQTEKKKLLEG